MKVLIVEARWYADVAAVLVDGATAALERAGVYFERLAVPGVLEIAPAIALAGKRYDGYVGLGCVLAGNAQCRLIAAESIRGLTRLGVSEKLCIGNAVLFTEDEAAAMTLADPARGDAGGAAAGACLALMRWRDRLS